MLRICSAALLLSTLVPFEVAAADGDVEPDTLADRGSPAWDRPILADPQAPTSQARPPRVFRDHGVGPTIDTTERPRSTLALDFDTASFGLARAALQRGELPPPSEIRVEEFVEVFAAGPPAKDGDRGGQLDIAIDAVASPQRRGYQLVRVTAYATASAPRPVDVVVAVDVSTSMATPPDLDEARETIVALSGALTRDDRLAVIELSSPHEVLIPLATPPSNDVLERELAGLGPAESPGMSAASLQAAYDLLAAKDRKRDRTVVVVGSGTTPDSGRANSQRAMWSLARRKSTRGAFNFTVGLGRKDYDDVLLSGLANAGRGAYTFAHEPSDTGRQLAQRIHQPLVAIDPVLEVEFDPAAVTRYRLLGFESRSEPAPARRTQANNAGLRAGTAVTALYEIKLRDGAPTAWGQARLRYVDPKTSKNRDLVQPLDGLKADAKVADANAQTQVAVLAAATAEKLRASYWARRLTWEQLDARFDSLPASVANDPDVARLGALIDDAASHEDRVESGRPRVGSDFDRQPVVR